jgi:hypothetical protein
MTKASLFNSSQQTLFLKGANGLCANLERNLLTIDNKGLGLKVWLPDFLSVTLRKAHVRTELLALAGDITFLHN